MINELIDFMRFVYMYKLVSDAHTYYLRFYYSLCSVRFVVRFVVFVL
jgi:hypothetical protein